jgi:hypothetical protein
MATPRAIGISGGQQRGTRMNNPDGGYEQRSNHYPQRGGLHTIVGTGLLAEKNIQRPAGTGPNA